MGFNLPLIIEADVLHAHLGDEDLIVIDLSIPQLYKEGHVPGAIHLNYPQIVYAHDDVDCDILPDSDLAETFSKLGLLP